MATRPPDEAVGTAAATELYELLRIAVDATRKVTWRPGDSLESLLAPAVVAIAAEAGKAVRPHAEQVRKQIATELDAHADECRGLAGTFDDERSELLSNEGRYFAAAARYISNEEDAL